MTDHALLSPSSAARRMACPGSLLMEQGEPDLPSDAAEDGTLTHELAADELRGVFDPDEIVDDERRERIASYVDYVRSLVGPSDDLLVEQRLDVSAVHGIAGQYGTADAIILHDDGLTIVDLKDGRVPVPVEGNAQLLLYAGAALEAYGSPHDTFVRLAIVQPRLDTIDEVVLPLAELYEQVGRVIESERKAWRMYQGSTPLELQAGEHCRYCKAQLCKARAGWMFGAVKPAAELTPAELAELLPRLPLVEKAAADLRRYAVHRVASGDLQVPGYKLVAGRRGARRWAIQAEEVAAMFGGDVYARRLMSPAEYEKHAKAEFGYKPDLSRIVTQAEGAPTLVPETDKRPAITGTVNPTEFEGYDNAQ